MNNLSSIFDDMIITDNVRLDIIGIVFVAMFCISLLSNTIVLYAFIKGRIYKRVVNLFSVVLKIVNLISTLLYLPHIIIGTYIKKVPLGYFGCQLQSVIMFFTGCFSIYILMILCIERYWILFRPFNINMLSLKFCKWFLIASGFLCFFWSLLPLFGWSRYSYEIGKLYCSIEWNDKSLNVASFNIVTMIVFFIIPLSIILYTNYWIFLIIKQRTTSHRPVNRIYCFKRLNKSRISQLMLVLTMSMMFILSWTPYATVSMYSAFIAPNEVNFYTAILPGILAKSTIVWCPFIDIIFNSRVKNTLFRSFIDQICFSEHEEVMQMEANLF